MGISLSIYIYMYILYIYDIAEKIQEKYGKGTRNVMELEEKGCLVLFGVDAKQMSQHFFLKTQRFNRIVYNFPHVGFLYPEDSCCQIQYLTHSPSLIYIYIWVLYLAYIHTHLVFLPGRSPR